MIHHLRFKPNRAVSLSVLAVALAAPPLVAAPRTKARPASAGAARASRGEYLLGPEDVLQVTVSNHSTLDSVVAVRPDGRITLPRAGELVARGKSARVLASEIQNRLALTLNNARVQVLVKEARPQRARIIGAVKTTGIYPLKPGTRALDLIAQAGGLSTKITRISGRVVRAGRVVPFDLSRAEAQPGGSSNLALLPDDLLVLDARDIEKQITVTGSVARPGAYDLEEGLTLVGLLAQAGGPLPNASLRGAQVLRGGKPVLSDLRAAASGDVASGSALARFAFRAGDVLLVPENAARFGVMGQVVRPSYFPLSEDAGKATVLKALSQAGGALPDGDLSAITITRTNGSQTQVIPVDATLLMQGKAPDTLTLRNDDVLLVPKRRDKTVSVIGQVVRPGSYPLETGVNLLSLLAEAGNPAPGAGLSGAYVLRAGVQVPVNLRAALVDRQVNEQVAGFALQDGDVLVVPDVRDQVQVIGQVGKPGAYSLDDDLTIMSLLSKSGAPTDAAALSRAYVQRRDQRIAFDLRGVAAGNIDPAISNFRFAAGDVLVLPENQARLAVLGQVARPGYYPFPENPSDASILRLLTAAGGPVGGVGGANLVHSVVIRTINGQAQPIPINIDQLFKTGKLSQQIRLQPDDVLYIPSKKQGFRLSDVVGPLGLLTTILP